MGIDKKMAIKAMSMTNEQIKKRIEEIVDIKRSDKFVKMDNEAKKQVYMEYEALLYENIRRKEN